MSRDFGNSGEYLLIADGDRVGISTWTAMIWVRMDATPAGGAALLTHHFPGAGNNMPVVIAGGGGGAGTTGRWGIGYFAGGSWRWTQDTGAAPTGQWNHICGSCDGASPAVLRYYRDGTERSNASPAGSPSLPTAGRDFHIGRRWDSNTHPNGLLEHAAIWNVVLTPQEIAALAEGAHPTTIRRGSLRAYWPIIGNASPEPEWGSGIANMQASVQGSLPAGTRSAPVAPAFGMPASIPLEAPVDTALETVDEATVYIDIQAVVTEEYPVVYVNLETVVVAEYPVVYINLDVQGGECFSQWSGELLGEGEAWTEFYSSNQQAEWSGEAEPEWSHGEIEREGAHC